MSSCRLASPNDLPALLELEQSAFPQARWASEESLRRRLEFPDSATWIAYWGALPVGFSNGFPISDRKTQEELDPADDILYTPKGAYWLLRNVAVRPSHQKMGFGKLLIDSQTSSARDYGCKAMRFTATEDLSNFYQSLGFSLIQPAKVFHGVPQAVWEGFVSA